MHGYGVQDHDASPKPNISQNYRSYNRQVNNLEFKVGADTTFDAS
jgi:hypothetical protein